MFGPFRGEAAASRSERQQLDHLLRVTAPHERAVLAGAGLVLLAFLVWAFAGSIVRNISLDGALVGQGHRHEVAILESGHLLEFQVELGAHVEAGETIARQTAPDLEHEISLLRDRVDLLVAEVGQAGIDGGAVHSLLESSRVALLQLEARRTARTLITSPVAGEVTALRGIPGDYMPAGTIIAQLRTQNTQLHQAVLRVANEVAQRIKPGMPAEVEYATSEGTTSRITGEVVSVTVGPSPQWLAALLHVPAGYGHQVEVQLHNATERTIPDGVPCRVRIELGWSSPIDLLIFGH